MSDIQKEFNGNSDPILANASMPLPAEVPSFRNSVPSTSMATSEPPVLPPRPDMNPQMNYMNQGMYGGMGGSYGMGGYGGYGYGNYGMGGMGMGMGMGGMGYGGYNRFGGPMGYGDIESRFIQMAEENSRPTFDSIQSLVNAVGSVAMMLESTFFALTTSFRAILGVAENFGRLRSLFAQFWSTFAVIRSINWLVRKLMVLLGIRTESEFKAWAQAVAATQNDSGAAKQQPRGSSWPLLLFFGMITAAPYIVLRMLSGLTSSINERLNDPTTWQNPLRAVAQHDFQAQSPQELSFTNSQVITIAPQHLQGHLWNSGWLMASTDRQHAGLVPVNYIKVIKPTNHEENEQKNDTSAVRTEPNVPDLEKYYGEEL